MEFTFDLQRFDSAFSGGSGSADKPYLISNQADLEQLAKDVNGNNDCKGLTFKLAADIDLSGVANFTPIGRHFYPNKYRLWSELHSFKGTFDGDGHTISNLTINSSDLDVGLFVGHNRGNATVSGNKYYSNYAKDDTNNTRYYKLTLPDSVTFASQPDIISDGTYTINDDTTIMTGNCPKIGNIVFDRATYKYLISSVADLQDLAAYVNAGNNCKDLTFKLAADIDLKDIANWTRIGNYYIIGEYKNHSQFAGTFDGDGHTISNLTINESGYPGLFGSIGEGGTVKNVTLTDITIRGNNEWSGGLASRNNGTISNCTVRGGSISSTSDYVGGLVAHNTGTISNCTVDNVSLITPMPYMQVGGLVGKNLGTVSGSAVIGGKISGGSISTISDYVGGLVAHNTGTVSDNIVDGTQITVGNNALVGGVVGVNNNGTVRGNLYRINKDAIGSNIKGTAENNTQIYKITLPESVVKANGNGIKINGNGIKFIDGVLYAPKGSTIKFTIETGVVLSENLPTVTVNEDIDLSSITVTDYWDVLNGANGSTDKPYLISTVEGLQYLANYVNSGNICYDLNFKLANDLDLSSIENFTPISNSHYRSFCGRFDGDGHKITNLKINRKGNNVGLFGYGRGNFTIKNITLENVDISGNNRVGALIGYIDSGSITNCKVSGKVKGSSSVGGLVGSTYTSIKIKDSTFTGTVSGNEEVGGLVGHNTGDPLGKYHSTVTNCTAFATINSTRYAGGLVGDNKGTVSDNTSYSNKDAIGSNNGIAKNNTTFYKITLPYGIIANGNDLKIVDGVLYATKGSTVTFTIKPGVILSEKLAPVTISNSGIDLSRINVTYRWGSASGADGSTDNPLLISNIEDLQYLATYVNAGHDCKGLIFKLTGDLDLSGVDTLTPIGNGSNQFNGTFDGDGHKISNLKISSASDYVGLFGNNGGNVKNLTLENVTVNGDAFVGGLAGNNIGTVKACKVSGKISGDFVIGGLVGRNRGTVTSNVVAVTVSGDYGVGGIVGNNNGTARDNFYYSNAGAVGNSTGTVENNTRLYKLTLPSGVTADGAKLIVDKDFYVTEGEVILNYDDGIYSYKIADDATVTIKDNKLYIGDNPISSGYATFTIKNSAVTYKSDLPESVIKDAYQFNADSTLLTLEDKLKDYAVKVKADDDGKVKWHYGSATLNSGSTLRYWLADEKNKVTLTSENYSDKITFSENVAFAYGEIEVDLLKDSVVSTKSEKGISFDNNSSANVTAPEGAQINIGASKLTVNNLPVNSTSGAGTITINDDGLSFSGYGVQFVNLEVAKESYFGKLSPTVVEYKISDKSYTIKNVACVRTLANDFTKVTFDISAAEKYAHYKVNDVEFLVASDADNINVVEAKDSTFKIQGKEIDAEKIGRVTLDEQITFSGTEINFDGVQVNYAQNKPVIYSLDGKEISISDAASLTTGDETKTFKCEAGSYVINGRTFETSADLTFTADTSEIKIPLSDAATEIYFDGVKVSGSSGELVFDLANNKVTIPTGATLNITSPDEVKLNLAAGSYTIDDKKISTDNELKITVDKDNIKVPLIANAVTINGAEITGTGAATIDNTTELLFSIILPDGALVKNTSGNVFELAGKNTSASFGDANKKVQLTSDGTAYITFENENKIGVGFNRLMFEQVEIQDSDAWTIETAGTSGIDKITGIKNGATISTSTEYVEAGDLRFEVETSGAGSFTIAGQKITTTGDATYVVYGNSDGEIKVALQGEEYADDDSEAAGKIYNFDTAGNHTINGITFHATENSKVQTITRGVEFDLSTGKFQYDGLTLSGGGTAQINRYNAKLVSLTDGAKVSSDDATKYQNRQFEINGAVELIGKKFETDAQIRCGLVNIQDTIENVPITLKGFVVDDKYVQIQNDCYDGVKVVDKKISSIEGVKTSAEIYGNSLANVSIVTTQSGEFKISGKTFKISGDSDGVTFVTDSHGDVAKINGLNGSVEGDFTNAISINGKAIQIIGASSIKVASDGETITEISNVAGDLITADGNSYRKNVRVYELGGAAKLTTSADGTIIFSGNKFEMSTGKTFTLDEAGNVLGLDKAQSDNSSANVAETSEENFVTINLSTTNNLDEVIGDFSEGLLVNGVPVRVTDSTNFIVKNDDQNIYIETTAPDTFTINGKTFTTYADKTIFKLDADGNVSEIVTDRFYLHSEENAYLIDGDFNDEIIFNGQKFCVTSTNDTTIFVGEETLIGVDLARDSVEVVESGGASEIAVTGGGNITIDGKTLTTSDDFVGTLQENSIKSFIGTISGKLGELELYITTIDSEDKFSVTGDGEKITAIDNLQNGSFACGDLNGLTINGATLYVDNLDETILTITDGELKISELVDSANVSNSGGKVNFVIRESGEFTIGEDTFKVADDNSITFTADENGKVQEISGLDKGASVQTAKGGQFVVNGTTLTAKDNDTFVGLASSAKIAYASAEEILDKLTKENPDYITISGKDNVTLNGGEVVVVEDTSAKVNITASKGNDTIASEGENVSVTFKGGATEIFALGGTMKISGYNASTGSGFHTDYENIFKAVNDGDIFFNKGRLTIGAAVVIDDGGNNFINFFNADGDLQKAGVTFEDTALDVSNEKAGLVLYAYKGSTLTAGAGSDSIFVFEGSFVDAGAGNNYIYIEERSANDDGATIAMQSGKATVDGFKAGFDDTSDRVFFGVNDTVDFKFNGTDLKVYNNGSLRGVVSDVADGADFVNILTADDNSAPKVAVAQTGAVITVEDEVADLYSGEKSGVDFTNCEENLSINLGSKNMSVSGEVLFTGINRVTLGGGQNTLISSSRNETLTGNGITEFIFAKDSGRDLIQNFNFDDDKISVGNETITAVNVNSSGGVRMEISGSAVLTLNDAQGKNFKINNFVALVDKNLTYNDEANYFVATSRNATLTVGDGAEIWLDNSHGKYFSGEIRTLDASTSTGKSELAGNDLDNKIFAGNGDASLWGGNGGDDLLIGGAGKNTFFYTNGNGSDTISGANNGDVVYLSQITLEQIASTNIAADSVAINFKDGGSLQINSAANVTYQLGDGSKFSANHEQATWTAN